jgi:hypothetical protein
MHLPFRFLVLLLVTLAGCTGLVGGEDRGSGGGDATPGGGTSGPGGGESGDGGEPATSGCRVVEMLANRCVSCHGALPSQGAPVSLTSLDALRGFSQLDAAQTNAQRSLARMKSSTSRMPPAPALAATADEVAALEQWVGAGMPACVPSSDAGVPDAGPSQLLSPNLIPQGELFTCTGAVSDAPTRVRRINRWEWTRNVGGAVTRSWTGFSSFDNPFDPSAQEPYGTYATDETVDEAMVEILLPIVEPYGEVWAGPYTGGNRLARLRTDVSLRCMWQDARPSQTCVRNYLNVMLSTGVLYRPPRSAELDRLLLFAMAVLAQESADGGADARTHSISRIVTAASLTSGALFREELGNPADTTRTRLADQELAQQLAYALGRRAPGAVPTWRYPDESAPLEGHYADIGFAARDGGIRNPQVVDDFIRRFLGGTDPTRFDLVQDFDAERRPRRGEYWLADNVAGFFREWLGTENVAEVFKERPEATSAWDDGGTSPYRQQLSGWGNLLTGYYGYEPILVQLYDDTIARVVVRDVDVVKNLLTTRQYYLPATVNAGFDGAATRLTGLAFGTSAAIDATRTQRWVTLPATERAGVLTHPAWLAAHGGNFEDDPSAVHRGKWVREQLLCGYVPPLSSVRVQAMVAAHRNDRNARARLEDATNKQECQGCHSLMNPLGYPFEMYNHSGFLRRVDHAPDGGWMPPDGRVTLTGLPDSTLNGPVRDAVELTEKLGDSPYVKRCFIRHAFRYFMGRDENRSDACTLASMEQAYDANNGSFRAMLTVLMTSDTWTTRRVPAQGE